MPREELVDEPGVQIARAKLRVLQNLPEEPDVGADAADVVFAAARAASGPPPRARVPAHTASFASSGSYSIGTVQPSYTQPSRRMPGPNGRVSRVSLPGYGRKLLYGSSA